MRFAICDDVAADRQQLAAMCHSYANANGHPLEVDEFPGGAALLAQPSLGVYDAVFLDIYMEQDHGIETAKALRRQGYGGALVFVTSSRDFYPESYEVNAMHYLVKPYRQQDLNDAAERIVRFYGIEKPQQTIALTVERQQMDIPMDQIRYVEVFNHTVYVHTKKHKLQLSASLNSLKKELDDKRFLQCHRSYIVNMDYIDYIDEDDSRIVLDTGEAIPVSRRERTGIRRMYIEYVFSKESS